MPPGTARSARTGPSLAAGPGRRFGQLRVTVVAAKDLKEPLDGSAKDPYVKVRIGDKEFTTQVAVNGRTAPVFGEEFQFEVGKAGLSKDIDIEAWFKQGAGQDHLVGRVRTSYMTWVARGGFQGDVELVDSSKQGCGKVSVRAKFDKPVRDENESEKENVATEERPRDPAGKFSDQEIKEAFIAFDLDRNHFVGAAEIRHILVNIGENASDEEVDEMIRMIDRDGDGQVGFEEFYEMVTGGKRLPPGLWQGPGGGGKGIPGTARGRQGGTAAPKAGMLRPGGSGAAPRIQERKQRQGALDEFAKRHGIRPDTIRKSYKKFQEGDRDNSGLIEYPEFCEVLGVEPTPAVEKLFKLFDKDGSGKIDIKEFMIGLSNFTGASKDEKLQFAFAVYDQDNSGSISREELSRILMANHLAKTPEEVKRKADTIMMQADKDGNGVITFDEFVAVSKKFPNILYPAFSLGQKVAKALA
jgi:serine/threonine-protein phosphatase 2B regulatory subunit